MLTLMLAAAAALLLGQAFWQPAQETVTVKLYTPETLRLTGEVICEAVTLPKQAGTWYALLKDGQRTAAGQTLYVSKKPDEAAERQIRITEAAAAGSRQPVTVRDGALQEALLTLSRSQGEERIKAAETLTAAVLAMGTSDTEAQAADVSPVRSITAPVSGVFVSDPTDETMGRIVTGDTWWVWLPPDFSAKPGETVEAELLSGIFRSVTMTVEEVTERGLRLGCREALAEAACMETVAVKIKKETGSGLEIPARSVYTEGSETGVWCLSGDSVRWKPITVLHRTEDTVIAALESGDTANLLPGDILLPEGGRK